MNRYRVFGPGFVLALAIPGANHLWAAAAVIDTISPSCASVGAPVTITGNGFGAQNVQIAVGGVPAPVVTATGNLAKFVVPAGTPLGATTVTATNPGGQTGSIAFKVCDLLVPDAWAGQWQITVTYHDASTGNVTQIDTRTAFIRSGEPFGLSTAVQRGTCTGSVSDTHMALHCAGLGTILTCSAGTNAQIDAGRSGDTITGTGVNVLTVTGMCGPLTNLNQKIEIAGLRLSLNQDPSGPPSTLVQSFVPFAALISGTP